jgi:arsenate reductase
MARLPGSVLFCCNHNVIRSPMAEGMMKKLHGRHVFVQSCGVRHDLEPDGFAIAVAKEIGVDLSRHRPKSFAEMLEWGDDIAAFDMIVALSPAAQRQAIELTRQAAVEIVYWPVLDPAGIGETREQMLDAYRETRDQIAARLDKTFDASAR